MALSLISTCLGFFSDPVKEHIVTPLINHISYAFTLDSRLRRLGKLVEDLKNKRLEMQNSIREAERNGEQIYEKVATWLSSAEKDIEEAEEILRGAEEAKKKCCVGFCKLSKIARKKALVIDEQLKSEKDIEQAEALLPGEEEAKKKCCVGFCPNLKSRFKLSKIAHKKALVIDEQLKNAQGLDPISFRPRPQPIVERGEALQSRVEILNQIVEAFKDPNLNPILVYGMGGIGKTTLAKEVHRRQAVDRKLFDDVVFVAVSETPNLRRIQGDLADALGLIFLTEGDRGRAMELHQRLKESKALIILDDVWEELKLSDIGIPSGEASKGCRIFLTSRKKNVLCIEMPTKKEFPLGFLEEKEAWTLFENILNKGDDLQFLANNPDFCDLAEKVVNKCGGLPLLIQIVATDLRNNKHLHAWRDMLNNKLEDVEGTDIEYKVHKVVESSYNNLKDEKAKSLFLLCPLFGNSNVRIQDLLIYCVGLGLFKNMDSIEESRDTVLTLIDKLKNESLLLEGDMAGFVKIHDVVRDIATTIAAEKHFAFVGKGQIESAVLERRDLRRISLPYCEIPKLPEVLQCPEAEAFSVFSDIRDQSRRLDIPDSFFEGVKKLKVLHLSSMSFGSGLPSSLRFLTGLQTLSLVACWDLTNVTIVAQLTQLKVLRIDSSNLAELPKEIEALAQLKLLDLTYCDGLKVIPSDVLSNMRSLEELYVFSSFDGWGTEGNASLVELKNLSRLTTLEIRVKDDKLLPEDWFFNGIKNYKISIGGDDDDDDDDDDGVWYYNKETSRMLKLELKTRNSLMDRIKEFMGGIEVLCLGEVNGIEKLLYDSSMKKMNSFQKLQCLHLKNCDSLREVIPFSSEKCLPHLQEMEVKFCPNIEAIVGEGNEDEVMELTQLTSLKLEELPNLIGICRTSGTVVSFPNLTSLKINECTSLKYVFTTSMARSFKQLKNLDIERCGSMEEIVLLTKCDEVVVFPQLKELQIEYCYSLKTFVGKVSNRSNINESSDEYLFNELVSFPNLTSLTINECDLKYVFTTSMARSFKQLKELNIDGCDSMEQIILLTKCDEVVVFPELVSVQLTDLPNLKRFICGYDPIGCPELRKLEIKRCPEMKNFVSKDSDDEYFFNQLVTLPNLEIMDINRMGDFRYLWHQQFADKDSFSKLKSLEIGYCGELSAVFPSNEYRRFERLESLHVSRCNAVKEIYEYEETNVLQAFALQRVCLNYLQSLKHIWSKDIDEAFSFQNLQSVEVCNCPELKYVIPASIACGLLQLQKLEIRESGVEMIIAELKNQGSEGASILTFEWPKLKSLTIHDCNKLFTIPTQDSFCFIQKVIPNVEVLSLDHHSLKAITESDDHKFASKPWKLKEVTLTNLEQDSVSFLFEFLRGIYSVEKLVLEEGSLGEIFLSDDERATGDQQQQYHLTLKHLHLSKVRKLKHIVKHIVKEDSQLNPISQCFQTLSVSCCFDMMNIAPSSSSSSVSFINLTTLHVSCCYKMTSLVTASTAKSMIQLMELQVSCCYIMEDIIVANEDGDSTEEHNDVIIFDKLKKLKLDGLSILNSFCSANYNFSFPLLEKVSIWGCKQMKKFCGGEVSTPKLHEIQNEYKQLWEGNLNATIASQLQQNSSMDNSEDEEDSSEM